jgi:hypothetical protein
VRVAEFLLQHVQPFRFFERRQVLALDVLDESDLQLFLFVDVELDGRDLVEAGQRGGAIPALAGDDLVAVGADDADENGLDDALLALRCCRAACAAAPRSAR